MEVIAQKKKSLIVFYAVLAVLGLAVFTLGIVFYVFSFWELNGDQQFGIICILCIGLIDMLVYVFLCFRVRFTAGIITYDGKKIDFGNGHIDTPSRIINVEYHKSYFTQKTDAWGWLTVIGVDFVFKYYYIDRVEEVCNRLIEIKNNAQID